KLDDLIRPVDLRGVGCAGRSLEDLAAEWLTARNGEDRVFGHEREHGGRVAALARPHPGLNHHADRLFIFGHLTLHWDARNASFRGTADSVDRQADPAGYPRRVAAEVRKRAAYAFSSVSKPRKA